jgi:hypothetical protein
MKRRGERAREKERMNVRARKKSQKVSASSNKQDRGQERET